MGLKLRRRTTIAILAPVILLGLVSVATVLAIRNPVAFLNRITPSTAYKLTSDVAYGDLDRQKLDVYRPTSPLMTPAPVIVFLYGGTWRSGSRRDYRFIGQTLAREGYTVVIPDYRIAPAVTYPAFLEDCANALRWVQDHISEYGGDRHRLFLLGHSAGAYNAMMLVLDRRYTAAARVDGGSIRGVIGIAGLYNFSIEDPFLQTLFGGAADPRDTQPISFARFGAPPTLLITSNGDDAVSPENSRAMTKALQAANSPVTFLEVPDLRHSEILLQMSPIWSPASELRSAVLQFIAEADAKAP